MRNFYFIEDTQATSVTARMTTVITAPSGISTYEGATPEELEKDFQEVVDDYIAYLKSLQQQ